MEIEEEKKYSDAYKAERQKEKETAQKLNEVFSKKSKHVNERVKEISEEENRPEPKRLFYEYIVTGAGLVVQMSGIFGRRFTVKETPEYKSVDNVLRYVVFPEPGQFYNITHVEPYKRLKIDNKNGDEYRSAIFEAYENALNILKYCRKNEIDLLKVHEKINPEFGTLFDYEVKKFFEENKDEELEK